MLGFGEGSKWEGVGLLILSFELLLNFFMGNGIGEGEICIIFGLLNDLVCLCFVCFFLW